MRKRKIYNFLLFIGTMNIKIFTGGLVKNITSCVRIATVKKREINS